MKGLFLCNNDIPTMVIFKTKTRHLMQCTWRTTKHVLYVVLKTKCRNGYSRINDRRENLDILSGFFTINKSYSIVICYTKLKFGWKTAIYAIFLSYDFRINLPLKTNEKLCSIPIKYLNWMEKDRYTQKTIRLIKRIKTGNYWKTCIFDINLGYEGQRRNKDRYLKYNRYISWDSKNKKFTLNWTAEFL